MKRLFSALAVGLVIAGPLGVAPGAAAAQSAAPAQQVGSDSGLPLRVTAEFDNWRRVEDADGEGGWIHYSQLSGVRTVLITQDMAVMRSRPQPDAPEVARLESGVIAHIMECAPGWCRLSIDGTRGWVDRAAFWGVDPGEILN